MLPAFLPCLYQDRRRREGRRWSIVVGRTFRSIILVVMLQAAGIENAPAAPGRDTVLIGYELGTIVVKTSERRLYYVLEKGQTVSYPVAVGKAGKTWTGVAHIQGKFLKPA